MSTRLDRNYHSLLAENQRLKAALCRAVYWRNLLAWLAVVELVILIVILATEGK